MNDPIVKLTEDELIAKRFSEANDYISACHSDLVALQHRGDFSTAYPVNELDVNRLFPGSQPSFLHFFIVVPQEDFTAESLNPFIEITFSFYRPICKKMAFLEDDGRHYCIHFVLMRRLRSGMSFLLRWST